MPAAPAGVPPVSGEPAARGPDNPEPQAAQLRSDVTAHLSRLRTLRDYPALQDWLTEWLEARLPPWSEFALVCSRLAGGCPPADLVRLLSGWLLLFSVSGPLDDYADQDKTPDAAWASLGWKQGNFVALALVAEAVGLLLDGEGGPGLAAAARVLLSRLEESALGQSQDIALVQTLEAYEQMLALKAATLTGALTESVAALAGADGSRTEALAVLGRELGMALQIVNDYLGVWRVGAVGKTAGGDLAQPQPTYPVFYALVVPHAYRDEFRALLARAPAERDTGRMLEILNLIGAPKFMRAAIELRQGRALAAVRRLSPECAADLERWCRRHLLGEGGKEPD